MRPGPAQKKSSRRKADQPRTPVRAWRNSSTTSRDTPVHVPHRDTSSRRTETATYEDTRDTVAMHPTFRGPEYEIISALEDLSDREFFLAKKRSEYAVSKPVMIERLSRKEPDFDTLERRLIDEASLLARFDHPNVLPLVELAGDEAFVYLAVEHVEGAPLEKIASMLRAKHRALPFEISAHLVQEVLRGLHHVHTRRGEKNAPLGIVLRDLTPSQLLVSRTGQVRLSLLGLGPMFSVKPREAGRGLSRRVCAFLAPECIGEGNGSIRSDVYSIGVMLFELLSGRECFSGRSAIEVLEEIKSGVSTRELERDGVPWALIDVVQRATHLDPRDRYASAADMADAIEAWLVGLARPPTPVSVERFFASHGFFGSASSAAFDPLDGDVVPLRPVRGRSAVVKMVTAAADKPEPSKKRAPATGRVAVEKRTGEVKKPEVNEMDPGLIFHGLTPPEEDGAMPLISMDSQIHVVLDLASRPYARASRPTGAAQPYVAKGAVKGLDTAERLAERRKKKRVQLALRIAIFVALAMVLGAMATGLLPVLIVEVS